jgi:RNA polymerase sigma-70 factor (ECF subfamily)
MAEGDDTKESMLALVRSPAPVVDEDHDLVVRSQRGEQAAFAKLFQKHHGRVYGMCTRLLSRRADVDDAVQQTFLEAWRCLHRFEGKSRFTTWLTRIAIHTSFSLRRRLRRLLLVDDDARALTVVDGGISDPRSDQAPLPADEVTSRKARSLALNEVLQQITEKKRIVFVLADLEDLTSPEVAEILGIPEATVRTRLFYARKEIAALLRTHKGFVDVKGLTR